MSNFESRHRSNHSRRRPPASWPSSLSNTIYNLDFHSSADFLWSSLLRRWTKVSHYAYKYKYAAYLKNKYCMFTLNRLVLSGIYSLTAVLKESSKIWFLETFIAMSPRLFFSLILSSSWRKKRRFTSKSKILICFVYVNFFELYSLNYIKWKLNHIKHFPLSKRRKDRR